MKKALLVLLAVTLALGAAAGCGNNESAGEGDSHITIMTYNGATGLNPLDGTPIDKMVGLQVFDRLVKYDADLKVQPCIAESWEVGEDNVTYTFKIKQGVKFHNGDTMSIDDVLFSLESYKASANGFNLDSIDSFRAVDDSTLEIVVKDYSAKLLDTLVLFSPVVCKAAYEADPEGFTDHPVGTGAYKFLSLGDGDSINMEAFADYHLGEPGIKEITFIQPMDSSTATIALETGEIDIISVLQVSQIDTIEAADGCSVFMEPGAAQRMMMFTGEPFLSNKKLRGAVYHAINIEDVIKTFCLGHGEVARNFYSAELLGKYAGLVDISDRYDQELAKQLLQESGYDPSQKIEFDCDAGTAKLVQIFQADLANIGLEIGIQQLEIPALVQKARKGLAPILIWESGEFDMSLMDVLNKHADENSPLHGVKDPVFAEIVARANAEKDPAGRDEIMKEAYEYMVDNWMMYPIHDSLNISAHRDRVKGIHGLGVLYVLYVSDLTLAE